MNESRTDVAKAFRFGGIVEGPVGDRGALRRAFQGLSDVGLGKLDLEIDGVTFSLLAAGEWNDVALATDARKTRFAEAFESFVEAARGDRPVESTLHCCEIFDDEVVETLFGVQRGEVRVVSRRRPLESRDTPPPKPGFDGAPAIARSLGVKRLGIVLAILLGGFTISAWQAGYIDRVLSTSAETLVVEHGVFEDRIVAEVRNHWGNYRVELERGPRYPTTAAAARSWVDAAEELQDQRYRKALVEGSHLFLKMLDESGATLAAVSFNLLPLLDKSDGKVEVDLPGRIGARRLVFSLTAE